VKLREAAAPRAPEVHHVSEHGGFADVQLTDQHLRHLARRLIDEGKRFSEAEDF
jgi:hypothetical protein